MGLFKKAKNAFSDISAPSTKSVTKSVRLIKESGPRVSLEKIKTGGGVNLSKSAEAAHASLSKNGLLGIRADMIVAIDHSYSMKSDYDNGKVQILSDKALAYGLQFDDSIEVIPWDNVVHPDVQVDLSNYQGIVNSQVYRPEKLGGTYLGSLLKEIKKRAEKATQPIFCCIITDGDPSDAREAEELICELAGYPVFIKFLAIAPVQWLQKMDDLGPDKRLLDNVDAKFYPGISSINDEKFSEDMADEWSPWIEAATKAGVLTA